MVTQMNKPSKKSLFRLSLATCADSLDGSQLLHPILSKRKVRSHSLPILRLYHAACALSYLDRLSQSRGHCYFGVILGSYNILVERFYKTSVQFTTTFLMDYHP